MAKYRHGGLEAAIRQRVLDDVRARYDAADVPADVAGDIGKIMEAAMHAALMQDDALQDILDSFETLEARCAGIEARLQILEGDDGDSGVVEAHGAGGCEGGDEG